MSRWSAAGMTGSKGVRTAQRVIGEYTRGEGGPLLIFTAGVHGNEPAGVAALRRVFDQLQRQQPPLRGRALALAANLGALELGVRYVDEDLNRMWTPERMEHRLGAEVGLDSSEATEQRELRARLDAELADGCQPVTLIDLHSTSGPGPPFSILTDQREHRRLVEALGVPAVLGLHQNVPGTLIDWFERRGHAAIVVEGGQNEAPRTIDCHAAVIWLALIERGLLPGDAVDLAPHRRTLEAATADLPAEIEVALRWGIEPGDRFQMEQGFANLQSVQRGQLLARSGRFGELLVRAPFDGLLLMPRYQDQGGDGFFLGLPPQAWRQADSRRA